MDGKAALDIIYQAEIFTSLVNGDNVYRPRVQMSQQKSTVTRKVTLTHETGWVVGVGTDFTVDFDEPLHDDFGHFRVVQGILQTVTKENNQGK